MLVQRSSSLAKWRKSKRKCSVLHKCSIEELPLNLALNPPFCQTACCLLPFLFGSLSRFVCWVVVVRWLGSSFAFFCLALCVGKNANVLPNALAQFCPLILFFVSWKIAAFKTCQQIFAVCSSGLNLELTCSYG